MLRRTFLKSCAALILVKDKIKKKIYGTIKIELNGKITHQEKLEIIDQGRNEILTTFFKKSPLKGIYIPSENEPQGKLINYINFDKPINVTSKDTLKINYEFKED